MGSKTKNTYSFKKTLLKGVEIFVMGGIAYLITYLSNLSQKPEYLVLVIAILKMIHNYLKNKNK